MRRAARGSWCATILLLCAACAQTGHMSPAQLSLLTLGPRGAQALEAAEGSRLYAMHIADAPSPVKVAADSVAVAKGLDPRCTRFFLLSQSVVALFDRFCEAGNRGRSYAALPVVRFSWTGAPIGTELRWESALDLRSP